VVEVESQWTARKREVLGGTQQLRAQSQNPRPVAETATRTGHPLWSPPSRSSRRRSAPELPALPRRGRQLR
jgi:hypothetical protein